LGISAPLKKTFLKNLDFFYTDPREKKMTILYILFITLFWPNPGTAGLFDDMKSAASNIAHNAVQTADVAASYAIGSTMTRAAGMGGYGGGYGGMGGYGGGYGGMGGYGGGYGYGGQVCTWGSPCNTNNTGGGMPGYGGGMSGYGGMPGGGAMPAYNNQPYHGEFSKNNPGRASPNPAGDYSGNNGGDSDLDQPLGP